MNAISRSRLLRQEADLVLQQISLYDILRSYGRVVATGSYYLDVMIYPDIDLYIPLVPIADLFQIAGRLALAETVHEIVFQKSGLPALPGGLYLKARVEVGDWGRPWKIDIWSLDEALIADKMADMQRFRAMMTPELKRQIVNYKLSILTAEQRTPRFSGFFVCKAFLDEGLSDHDQVTQYLIDHGIDMDSA